MNVILEEVRRNHALKSLCTSICQTANFELISKKMKDTRTLIEQLSEEWCTIIPIDILNKVHSKFKDLVLLHKCRSLKWVIEKHPMIGNMRSPGLCSSCRRVFKVPF